MRRTGSAAQAQPLRRQADRQQPSAAGTNTHHDAAAQPPKDQKYRFHESERFQGCLSRVRTALAMTVMRFGLMRDLRKICQDFSRAMPRSTGVRAAARARLAVRWVRVSSPPVAV